MNNGNSYFSLPRLLWRKINCLVGEKLMRGSFWGTVFSMSMVINGRKHELSFDPNSINNEYPISTYSKSTYLK